MKEVKVMQIIPNLGLAGAEIMVENLASALVKEGYNSTVVSLYSEHSAITDRLETNDITVVYLGKKGGIDLKVVLRLYKLFLKEQPYIVHTHRFAMQYVIPAAVMAKIPIKIHTVHNVADKEVSKAKRKLHSFFYRYFKVTPVAISPLIQESIAMEYNLSKAKIPMIFNGLDLRKCTPKINYKANNITILHVGRFSEQKNHEYIIENFKIVNDKLPNTTLQLIGFGELEDEMKYKVKSLNLDCSVEFLGLKTNVYPYFNSADIFILPSLWEGMPITLIEAMATGLPIIATEVGGIPDMIENEKSGIIIQGNDNDLSRALIRLIEDETIREKFGQAAKKTSEKYSDLQMAKEYSRLYS